jgi:hypothetical protein
MVRLRRRDAGISMILVVVLILITLILAVAATVLFADFKEKERTQKALEKLLNDPNDGLIAQEGVLKAARVKANEPVGLKANEEGALPDGQAKDLAKKKKQEYWSPEHLDKIPLVASIDDKGNPKPRPAMSPDQIKNFQTAREDSRLFDTLQELAQIAIDRTLHYKTRMDQLELELKLAKEATLNREAIRPEIPKPKIAVRERLAKEIADVTALIGKENTEYNERKAKFNEDKAKADQEVQAETEQYAQDEIKLTNETRELRRQLEDLKVKEIIKHELSFAHGKILRPDVPNKIAFIDIGTRERVVPGLKFLVGKRGARGKFDFKGKIEVKKAWSDRCEVAIIELYDPEFRPIVEGDQIVNPLFSKDRPVIVAFVGEDSPVRLEPKRSNYTVDEATRRIREIGSEVRKEVTLDVDYVIFTEAKRDGAQPRARESYPAFAKAVFLEIPIAEAGRTPDGPGVFEFLGD